jgi:hypothetical protein
MENHPIPQDVTGFQFKLIGSMTLKQFGYLGTGVVLAALFLYSPMVWYLKLILVPLLAISGVSLAFLPIEGRPVDLMARYFITAILRPNQYFYQKVGGTLSFTELNLQPLAPQATNTPNVAAKNEPQTHKKEAQLLTYLYDTAGETTNPLDQRENQFVSALFAQPMPVPTAQAYPLSGQTTQNISGPNTLPIQNQQQIQKTPAFSPTQSVPSEQVPPVQTQPNEPIPTLLTQEHPFQGITPQPAVISSQPNATNQQYVNAPGFTMQPVPPATFVQVVPTVPDTQPSVKKLTGMEFPNLVMGIVKDSRGNMLSGILVEVKNSEGESVRAFKTNTLGQFASATQLTNGTYTIVFEDPKGQHKFDTVQVEANGSVLTPLTIISIDAREELRRSLFE